MQIHVVPNLARARSEPQTCNIPPRTLLRFRTGRQVRALYGMSVEALKPHRQVLFGASPMAEAALSAVDQTHQCIRLISLMMILRIKTTASWKADWLSPWTLIKHAEYWIFQGHLSKLGVSVPARLELSGSILMSSLGLDGRTVSGSNRARSRVSLPFPACIQYLRRCLTLQNAIVTCFVLPLRGPTDVTRISGKKVSENRAQSGPYHAFQISPRSNPGEFMSDGVLQCWMLLTCAMIITAPFSPTAILLVLLPSVSATESIFGPKPSEFGTHQMIPILASQIMSLRWPSLRPRVATASSLLDVTLGTSVSGVWLILKTSGFSPGSHVPLLVCLSSPSLLADNRSTLAV